MPETTKRLALCDQMALAAMLPDDAPGHKWQTRRLVTFPRGCDEFEVDLARGLIGFGSDGFAETLLQLDDAPVLRHIPFAVGDRVALTEAFLVRHRNKMEPYTALVRYRCDSTLLWLPVPESHRDKPAAQPRDTWLAARFMPLWAVRPGNYRIITRVRCERVQDISKGYLLGNLRAEGCLPPYICGGEHAALLAEYWIPLWDKLHGAGAWQRNDWVFPYSFKREEAESDDD